MIKNIFLMQLFVFGLIVGDTCNVFAGLRDSSGRKAEAKQVTPNNDAGRGSWIQYAKKVDVQPVVNGVDDFIVLPFLDSVPVGHEIMILCNAGTNFIIRTPAASDEEINSEDCDGTKEYVCTDTEILRVIKSSGAVGWEANAWSDIGTAVTAVIPSTPTIYYVDSVGGDDADPGTLALPFETLGAALSVVSTRVATGITRDKIYLRAGTYRNDNFDNGSSRDFILYNVNLEGTASDSSFISAMPSSSGAPNSIQRKSGDWYEKVVFDDGYTIPPGSWAVHSGSIYKSTPGYINSKWGSSVPGNRGSGISWESGTNSDDLAIGPRMVLQDGVALEWVDPWPSYNVLDDAYNATPTVDPTAVLTGPGMRTFDQLTGTLYVWPISSVDPSTVVMESWKGSYTDVRFRHFFEGSMEYTDFKGIEFRLFTSLFDVDLIENYQYLKWEDNVFTYGWKHLISDPQTFIDGELNSDAQQESPMYGWEVRNNVFFRPSREVFQIYGDNHIFEYNEVIEHGGSWAGGVAMVSAINPRHMNDVQIRYNYIRHLGNWWRAGSAIMFETTDDLADINGENIYGGGIVENNFIGNMNGGTGIFLGKSGCRMRDITIRNNVFAVNLGTGVRFSNAVAILVTSPHTNLQIHNNVFFEHKRVFKVSNENGGVFLEDMSNTISMYDNIYMDNLTTHVIDDRLSAVATIDRNIFYNNVGNTSGTNVITDDPLFNDAANYDFNVTTGSPAIVTGDDIGVYNFGESVPTGADWWNAPTYAP